MTESEKEKRQADRGMIEEWILSVPSGLFDKDQRSRSRNLNLTHVHTRMHKHTQAETLVPLV